MPSKTLTLQQARHLVVCSQALDRSAESVVEAVRRAGFIRTLGGVEAYLAVRARSESAPDRAAIDDSLSAGDLHVCPSVRGCIYLVPSDDRSWSIACADLQSRKRRQREYAKLELTTAEIETLSGQVLAVLDNGPATTAEVRKALPDDAVRSFGDVGKKIGITTALPPVLRELEFMGAIERKIRSERLDSETYCWHASDDPSLSKINQSDDFDSAVTEHIARVYLRSWPLASVDGFAHWSGFGKRLAKAALTSLQDEFNLQPVSVEGLGEFHAAQRHLDRADQVTPKALAQRVTLLPSLDNAVHLAGGLAFFADEPLLDVEIPKRGMTKAATVRDSSHIGVRSVLLGGRMAGFWEYDPESESIALGGIQANKTETAALNKEAAATGAFLRDDVGHGRSFSLDTEKDQRRRVVWFSQL